MIKKKKDYESPSTIILVLNIENEILATSSSGDTEDGSIISDDWDS